MIKITKRIDIIESFPKLNYLTNMNKEIIALDIQDGSTTKITLFSNPENKDLPVVICFPAMGVKAAYYEPFATDLANKGYILVTADLRGLGHSSVRASRQSDFSYLDILDLDYHTVLEYINNIFSKNKKYILGHSLGGQLASLYVSRAPKNIDGLILIACCSVYYKGWEGSGAWQVLLMTQLSKIISQIWGYFPGHRLGFGGKESRSVIRDWSQQARTGKYLEQHTAFDFEKGLQVCQVPILAISIEGDYLAPPKAVKNLTKKFQANNSIQHIHIPTKETKLDHFKWARKPKLIVETIEQWIK